ncbi:hypothetical protein ACJJTC_010796 [Scirpophaga incertulas]
MAPRGRQVVAASGEKRARLQRTGQRARFVRHAADARAWAADKLALLGADLPPGECVCARVSTCHLVRRTGQRARFVRHAADARAWAADKLALLGADLPPGECVCARVSTCHLVRRTGQRARFVRHAADARAWAADKLALLGADLPPGECVCARVSTCHLVRRTGQRARFVRHAADARAWAADKLALLGADLPPGECVCARVSTCHLVRRTGQRARFVRHAADARAWAADKLALLGADLPPGEVTNLEDKIKKLQKHQAFTAELAANKARLQELEVLADQLRPDEEVEQQMSSLINTWDQLEAATAQRGRGLEEAQDILEFNQQLDKIEAWIRDKEMMVVAHDLGRDYEHCSSLIRKLDDLDSDMKVDDGRVKRVCTLAQQLLRKGGTQQAAGVAARRDALLHKWQALSGALAAYRASLAAALELHSFHRDVEDTEERIAKKAAIFSSTERGRELSAAHELMRRHNAREAEAQAVGDRIQQLTKEGRDLQKRHPEREKEIEDSLQRLQGGWHELLQLAARRTAALEEAIAEHKFDDNLKELEEWVSEAVARMQDAEPPDSVNAASALLELHQERKAEIDGRQKAIAALQKEVEQYPEKQQKLELLSKTLDEAWLQRKQSLTEAHQLQLLKARARAAEDWLAAKEAFLNNDDLGADLDAVETLIRKHQEFSKILESQHGRVGELETFARGLLTDGHGDAAYIQKRLDEVLARAERLEVCGQPSKNFRSIFHSYELDEFACSEYINESCARRSRLLQQSRQLLQLAHDLQQERDWIERKAQFAADTSYMDMSNLQSKMQKQTAFEAELAANKGRIDAVASKGEELIDAMSKWIVAQRRGTSRARPWRGSWSSWRRRGARCRPRPRSAACGCSRRCRRASSCARSTTSAPGCRTWRRSCSARTTVRHPLPAASRLPPPASRRPHAPILRLQQALQARVFLRALDDFCAWLQDVEAQLLSEDHGQDLRSTQALLAKHARLEQQAAAKKEEPAQLAETAAALAADSHFLAEHLVERADAALTRYRQLQEPMQSRRDNLEDAELLHRWERDADDELAWLKEREAGVLSEEAGASLADTQALLKKHIAVEAEIAAREPSVKGVCSRATQLARRGHFAASALEARGRALLAAYCALHDAAAARAAALRDRRDLLQVLLLLSKSCSWRAAGTSPRPRWRRAAGRCWPRTARCTTRPPRAPPRCATAATCCRYYYCYLSRAAGAPRALRRVRAGGARPGAAGRLARRGHFAASALEARGRALLAAYCALHDAAAARAAALRDRRDLLQVLLLLSKSCSWRAAGTSPRPRWRRAAGRCWPRTARCTTRPPRAPPRCATAATCCRYYYCYLSRAAGAPRALRRVRAGGARPGAAGRLARRGHFAASALEARGRALLAAYCALHDAAAARAAALRDRRDLLQVLLLLSKSCSWRAAGTSPRPRWRRAAGRCWPRTARCTTRPPRAPPRCATAATCCRYYYCYLSRAAGAPRALRRVRAGGARPGAAGRLARRGHFAASALEARGRALLAAYCALHDAAAARAAALRDRRDLLQVLLLLSKSCSWRAAGTSPRRRWRRAAGRCWPRTARCTTRPPRAPPRCATAATCCRYYYCYLSRAAGAPRALRRVRAGGARPGAAGRVLRAARRGRRAARPPRCATAATCCRYYYCYLSRAAGAPRALRRVRAGGARPGAAGRLARRGHFAASALEARGRALLAAYCALHDAAAARAAALRDRRDLLQVLLLLSKSCSWRAAGTSPRPRWRRAAGRCWPRTARCTTRPPRAPPRCATAATCCRYYYCYLSRAAGAPRALRRVRAGGARPGAAGRLARRGHFAASALEARGRALLAAYCALHDAAAARAAALRDRRDLLQVLLLLSKSCSWRAAGTSPRPRWRRAAGRCWPRTARCTTRPPRCATAALRDRRDLLQVLLLLSKSCSWRAAGTSPRPRWRRAAGRCWPRTARCTTRPPRAPPRCATAATCCRYYYCYLSRAAGAPRALRRVRAGGARPGAAGRVLRAARRGRRAARPPRCATAATCCRYYYCYLSRAAGAPRALRRVRAGGARPGAAGRLARRGHFAASALEARGRALLAAYCALHDAAAARAAALRDRRDLLQVLLLLSKSCSWRAAGTSPRPRWRRAAGRCWPRTARCTTRPPRCATAALRDRRDLLQPRWAAEPAVLQRVRGLRAAYDELTLLCAQWQRRLQQGLHYYKFATECASAAEWMEEQMSAAASEEYGRDVEHVESLQQAFSAFLLQLNANEGRIEAACEMGTALLEEGAPEEEKIKSRIADLRGLWEDLKELALARQEALAGARRVHEFDRRAEETAAWVAEKAAALRSLGARPRSLHSLHAARRALAAAGDDLRALSAAHDDLAAEAAGLGAAFPDAKEHVSSKLEDVTEALRALSDDVDERSRQLELAGQLQAYFGTYQELLAWLNEMQARVTAAALGRDVAEARRLLERHAELCAEIAAKDELFQRHYDHGEHAELCAEIAAKDELFQRHYDHGEHAELCAEIAAKDELFQRHYDHGEHAELCAEIAAKDELFQRHYDHGEHAELCAEIAAKDELFQRHYDHGEHAELCAEIAAKDELFQRHYDHGEHAELCAAKDELFQRHYDHGEHAELCAEIAAKDELFQRHYDHGEHAELCAEIAAKDELFQRHYDHGEHAELCAEIAAKDELFQRHYDHGEKLIRDGHFMSAEIAEKTRTLQDRRQQLQEICDARGNIYRTHLDALTFLSDAAALDAWISSREPLVRDGQYGESLSQVEQLINRHQDLEGTIQSQEDKVRALHRTTLIEEEFAAQREKEEAARRRAAELQAEQRLAGARRDLPRIPEPEESQEPPQQETLSPAPQFELLPKPEPNVKRAESMSVVKTPKRTPSFTTRRRTQSFRRHRGQEADLPPVEIEGFLERKQEAGCGGKRATVRSWRAYYAVLCGQLLCFFKDELDFTSAKAAAPPVAILNARCSVAGDYRKRAHVFRLACADGAEYLFSCGGAGALRDWVAKLAFHAQLPPALQLTPYAQAQPDAELRRRLHQ